MKVFASLFMKGLAWLYVTNYASSHNFNSLSVPRTIPGGANFTFCPESQKTDLYDIEEIEAFPHWPPKLSERGDDIFFHVYGKFLKNISDNATWFVDISVEGSLEHANATFDFCTMSPEIDQPDPNRNQSCPPEKGFAILTYWLPILGGSWGPTKGLYHLHVDAVTKEGERIYCVENTAYLESG